MAPLELTMTSTRREQLAAIATAARRTIAISAAVLLILATSSATQNDWVDQAHVHTARH